MGNTHHARRKTLLDSIRDTIKARHLIPDGAKVVAGVSGGADSVALLRALYQLGIPCTVAHLNHGLRGADSDADEQFVRKLAEELTLPVTVRHVDVRALAEGSGLSIEMAARQARHDFFAEFGNAVIALAHHADDQVETFMLRLARGAGCEGLCGMSPSQQVGPVRLIRPLLGIPRAEILKWLQANGFTWCEDASNKDEDYLRNKVRHTILPLLEKELNPNIRATILRTMDILGEEDAWMNSVLSDFSVQVSASPTAAVPLAARRRMLRAWLFSQGVEVPGFEGVEKILALMDSEEGTRFFELNDHQRVVIEYGVPRLEDSTSESAGPDWTLSSKTGTGWRKDHGRGAGMLPAEASFNAEKIGDAPIQVRSWQPGDRMEPLGMAGSRKLQDILTDQKVPLAQRCRIPVVTCRDEIIWLPGYRTARGWEVAGPAGKAVHLRIEQDGTASFE